MFSGYCLVSLCQQNAQNQRRLCLKPYRTALVGQPAVCAIKFELTEVEYFHVHRSVDLRGHL
jgi:hypothetical protein